MAASFGQCEWLLANDVRPQSSDASAWHIPRNASKYDAFWGLSLTATLLYSPPSLGWQKRDKFPGISADGVRTGGEEGIRTPGSLPTSTVFKTAAFNHSATSPVVAILANHELARTFQCTTGAGFERSVLILRPTRLHRRGKRSGLRPEPRLGRRR